MVYQDSSGKAHNCYPAALEAEVRSNLSQILDGVGKGGTWDHDSIIEAIMDASSHIRSIFSEWDQKIRDFHAPDVALEDRNK